MSTKTAAELAEKLIECCDIPLSNAGMRRLIGWAFMAEGLMREAAKLLATLSTEREDLEIQNAMLRGLLMKPAEPT